MNKVEIGQFIRLNRQLQKLSQQGLAEKAGLTRRQQIIEMESASTDYGINVLIKVVSALGYRVLITQHLPEKSAEEQPIAAFDFSKVEPAIEEPKEKLQKQKTKPNLANSKKNNNAKKGGTVGRKTKSSRKNG